jgi:hypothetical protein
VHSDIGGGYKEAGLSYIASQWISNEASKFGLQFEPHFLSSLKPDPKGKQHNERTGIYRARKELVREITGAVHVSVKKRWDLDVDNYRKKSKALTRLLETTDNDWALIRQES